MRLIQRSLLRLVFLLIPAVGTFCPAARADEKGDDLLKQVRVTAQMLAPLVGEYTVTLHTPTGDLTEKYQSIIKRNGRSFRGGRYLPPELFNLFDPITKVPAVTRYLGRQKLDGEAYEGVELKISGTTFQLFLGSDGLIHRAHATLGTPPQSPLPFRDPKTGKMLTPEQMAAARVTLPTKTDANPVEIVVTSYHKVRTAAPRPEISTAAQTLSFPNPNRFLHSLVLSPDGRQMAAAFSDNAVQIVDARTGEVKMTLAEPVPNQPRLAFSPDGLRLLTTAFGLPGVMWDALTGKKLFSIATDNKALADIAFSPDGKLLAGANGNSVVFLWNAITGKELPPLESPVQAVQFSPDSQNLAALHFDQKAGRSVLTLWDTATWKPLSRTEMQAGYGTHLTYSPDSKWIAVSEQDGHVFILDGVTGAARRELREATGMIIALRFAADSKTLLVVDTDMRGDDPSNMPGLTLWNTTDWKVTHARSLSAAGFLFGQIAPIIFPDGRSILTAGTFKGLKIWTVPTDQE